VRWGAVAGIQLPGTQTQSVAVAVAVNDHVSVNVNDHVNESTTVKHWDRAAIILLCAPFAYCVQHRAVVTLPGLQVTVVDASGAPVTGAEVIVHWWSYPHARLEETHRFTTDASGAVVTTEASRSERIAPFCMHGVPEHHYTLCAGSPGQGWSALEVEPKQGPVTVTLPGGDYAGECADHDRARFAR
jgi:hypothetical protein